MKVVVVANGEPAPGDVGQLADADLVIAADGGAEWLEAVGRRPDLLVGDLDSLDDELRARIEAAGVRVERHRPDKDASDAELAIRSAFAAGADEVVLLGTMGGKRLDHALAGVLLLTDDALVERQLRMVQGGQQIRALRGGQRLELRGGVGDVVTLLPLGGDAHGIVTEGLRYPLHAETLRVGASRGLSNEVLAIPAAVELERGTLLVIEIEKGAS